MHCALEKSCCGCVKVWNQTDSWNLETNCEKRENCEKKEVTIHPKPVLNQGDKNRTTTFVLNVPNEENLFLTPWTMITHPSTLAQASSTDAR